MRSKFYFAILLSVLVLPAWGGSRTVNAHPGQTGAAAAQSAAGVGGDYLILFAIPELTAADFPIGGGASEIDRYAARIVARQAERIRPELARFQAHGQLTMLGTRGERNGILVRVQDPAVLERLSALPEIQGIYPSEQSLTCSTWTAADLKMALQSRGSPAFPSGARAAAAGSPVITVYHFAEGNWGEVSVSAGIHAAVSLKLIRGGVVVGTGAGITYADGTYTFYPSAGGCDSLSNWDLQDGDVAEVTANGSTASTTVVPIDAWLDPTTNMLNGVTAAFRTVQVDLHTFAANPCAEVVSDLSTASDAAGAFSRSATDFNRQAYAVVRVMDGAGNSTYAEIHAFDIELGLDRDRFYIHWKSSEVVAASLIRNGSAITTWNWTTPKGWYAFYLTVQAGVSIQTGDILFVTSDLGSMTYTVTPFTMNMNPATDNINGTAGANRPVIARVYKPLYSACTDRGCANSLTDGAGLYSMTANLDQGDEADLYAFDSEGNVQVGPWQYTPYLVAEPVYNDVGIRWINANPLTVTLKNNANSTKEVLSGIVSAGYDPSWLSFTSATLVTGDHIEATDGVTSITVTVSSLGARLNSATGHLTGTSASAHLKAVVNDHRYGAYFSQPFCQETTAGGTFDLTFPGSQIGPQDWADTWLTSPEGYYIYNYADAFTVDVGLGTAEVFGTTEMPGASVTVKLKRSGNTLVTISGPADSTRWYALNVSPEVVQAGDVIEVTTDEGNSAVLSIPNLSINVDGPGSRLYGNAPANEPLRVDFKLQTGYQAVVGTGWMTAANQAGVYSLSTTGLLTYNCAAVLPGAGCTTAKAVYYYPSKEHAVFVVYQNTASALADIYEPDNTFSTGATTRFGRHTFDTIDDVDWVKIVVPAADVSASVKYLLQTLNLGPGLDTVLELYGTNGTTLILSNNDDPQNPPASRIDWVPPAAGTYYLKVRPYSSSSTRYCGAVYDLVVLAQRNHMFMPMLRK